MLDARPRSFYSVPGAGNNHFTSAREARDDRANGIVASVTGALGFRDCQLHKPLFRFVGSRDHVDPKLTRTLGTNCDASPPKLPYLRNITVPPAPANHARSAYFHPTVFFDSYCRTPWPRPSGV